MDECRQQYFFFNEEFISCHQFFSYRKDPSTEIYEVLRIMQGNPLFIMEHYERFVSSHQLKNIKPALTETEFQNIITKLIRKNEGRDGNIKIVSGFNPDTSAVAYTMAWYMPHHYPLPEMYRQGVSTVLYPFERPQPNAKVWNHDLRAEIAKKLKERNAFEALLVNAKGCITEGSKSNIFAVKDNGLITPGSANVLPGITRQKVFELSVKHALPILEKPINALELEDYDAFFITGTSPQVLPLRNIENHSFAPDHPVVKMLMEEYSQLIANHCRGKI